MEESRRRYPGAQPFSDDLISRTVFFGRHVESAALRDQILANRLVVVFAKSGLGKTSLLQAGVAQPLRDEGYLPLFVRVNNIKQDPLRSVFDGVKDAAARWGGEYSHGSELSLWHFFKTVEFWQMDRLLTPVLVLDQFEELFTLHPPEARAGFLPELGHLVRGVQPELNEVTTPLRESQLTEIPPEIRIVLSLREDYLGALEEASNNIPQVLDHRFRLTPLTVEAATAALEGPSRIADDWFETRPFTIKSETVRTILSYLSQNAKGLMVQSESYVEPFHLQLICQRVEALVAEKQRQTNDRLEIILSDLGGEQGLKETLRDFYKEVLNKIFPKSRRNKVRRLCEQYLISPEGRRLSLELNEIKRILKLKAATLRDLVDYRLLRSDQRTNSWYYELSHDSLVNPILATRKTQGITFGLMGFLGCIFAGFSSLFILGVSLYLAWMFSIQSHLMNPEEQLGLLIIIGGMLPFGLLGVWLSVVGLRKSVETLNRYIAPPA